MKTATAGKLLISPLMCGSLFVALSGCIRSDFKPDVILFGCKSLGNISRYMRDNYEIGPEVLISEYSIDVMKSKTNDNQLVFIFAHKTKAADQILPDGSIMLCLGGAPFFFTVTYDIIAEKIVDVYYSKL